MKKYNGKGLDAIILASHLRMMNWEALEAARKPNIIMDNIAVIVAVALTVYTCIR